MAENISKLFSAKERDDFAVFFCFSLCTLMVMTEQVYRQRSLLLHHACPRSRRSRVAGGKSLSVKLQVWKDQGRNLINNFFKFTSPKIEKLLKLENTKTKYIFERCFNLFSKFKILFSLTYFINITHKRGKNCTQSIK